MKRDNIWIFGALLLAGIVPVQWVSAQPAQVQAIRPSGEILNNHLARLASNPRDVTALIGAGEAALDMDDARAAAGFFARADVLQPNNGKVKAGLGRVMLKNQNPAEALRLFDQAVRLGYSEATLLGDRGLARDMTGDQAGAQRDYQAALQRTPDDVELTHRYAASLGISGQVDAAERVLKPLLYKSDRAAWRYRAFILAMNNRQADAKKIAEQTMPSQLATAILPYMQKMPYLTAAQKAAAVHFGHFPANVGTTIAAITPTPPAFASAAPVVRPPVAETPQPAKPARQDRRSRSNGTGAATLAQAEAPPRAAPAPVRQAASQPAQPPAPAPASQATLAPNVQGPPAPGFESVQNQPAAPATPPSSQLNAITLAQASAPQSQSAPAPSPAPTPPAATAAAAPSTATPQPQIDPAVTRSLADIIHAIDVPESERQPSAVAVDLTEIAQMQATRRAEREAAAAAAADKAKKAAAAKAKAEADAKAKQLAEEKKKAAEEKARLAANPSRNWLQVGTGANKGALAFTMKGLRKKYDSLEPQDAWVAGWGRTNRLLVGPFASFNRAKTLEDKLKAAGADVFAWKSDAGEVVERLPAK
ncbi:SPOR domain-containing protein [Sphingobium chlorophenolicum]|uniref:Sporulation domain-containing protein n=1 Tax=Sphingobium chlorophenolicum TaxID=46429 RepID=A0A081RJ31_SPHCR|nr:SPOR domain-containing protein [Sphingobium chlorophenolicum]KEQ55204.1 Sporulation domain-containing protein precursor [Sphingobium chlorophenolicum]